MAEVHFNPSPESWPTGALKMHLTGCLGNCSCRNDCAQLCERHLVYVFRYLTFFKADSSVEEGI